VGRIAPGASVVLLSDMFRDTHALNALRSLVDVCGATVVAVATLVEGPTGTPDVRTVSLEPGADVTARVDA
jgi:adenine/guanine phosphoribosyltransferase-like PRPP-binding protein